MCVWVCVCARARARVCVCVCDVKNQWCFRTLKKSGLSKGILNMENNRPSFDSQGYRVIIVSLNSELYIRGAFNNIRDFFCTDI